MLRGGPPVTHIDAETDGGQTNHGRRLTFTTVQYSGMNLYLCITSSGEIQPGTLYTRCTHRSSGLAHDTHISKNTRLKKNHPCPVCSDRNPKNPREPRPTPSAVRRYGNALAYTAYELEVEKPPQVLITATLIPVLKKINRLTRFFTPRTQLKARALQKLLGTKARKQNESKQIKGIRL